MADYINPTHGVIDAADTRYLNEFGLLGTVSGIGVGSFGMGRAEVELGASAGGRATPEQET